MKFAKILTTAIALALALSACGKPQGGIQPEKEQPPVTAVEIQLSDDTIQVDGAPITEDSQDPVYTAKDIIYYETGKDFTYGEGTAEDAHSPEDAAAHTVVHIAKAGTYRISGKLSKGQIAVDLGKEAKGDPTAVVTLILDGADITCEVAPAVIFYNVYECGNTENPSKDVDTVAAGANVVIADGSKNTVNGSYVARIYKPETVVLNEGKTEVEDAEKLHKYDGAFYSKMSMNITGEKESTGVLNIHAANEGLDSEMHLTFNGGNINIYSGNDGINTNEDGVSVTTVNGGALNILVTGETGEGDGIDSNGWLVINGGSVVATACARSADAGIDSDMGIHISGGTVIAAGSMLDRIEEGGQTYAVFNFAQRQSGEDTLYLRDEAGKILMEHYPRNAYSVLVFSGGELKEGTYTLWSNDRQLAIHSGGMTGNPPDGMMRPEGMERPQGGEKDWQPPEGEFPFDEMTPPERPDRPEKMERPEGQTSPELQDRPNGENQTVPGENTAEFKISAGGNMFGGIAPLV